MVIARTKTAKDLSKVFLVHPAILVVVNKLERFLELLDLLRLE